MATKKTVKKIDAPIDQHETFVSLQKTFADSEMSVAARLMGWHHSKIDVRPSCPSAAFSPAS